MSLTVVIEDDYEVVLSENGGCHVFLLPQGPLLFQASLDWLVYSGELEDGDATHKVPPEIVSRIEAWAAEHSNETAPPVADNLGNSPHA